MDLIGPYKFIQKNKKPIQLWAVTMIDPATGWFEIREIKTKRADIIANEVELTCLLDILGQKRSLWIEVKSFWQNLPT